MLMLLNCFFITMVTKILCKTPCVFENKHFFFLLQWFVMLMLVKVFFFIEMVCNVNVYENVFFFIAMVCKVNVSESVFFIVMVCNANVSESVYFLLQWFVMLMLVKVFIFYCNFL